MMQLKKQVASRYYVFYQRGPACRYWRCIVFCIRGTCAKPSRQPHFEGAYLFHARELR